MIWWFGSQNHGGGFADLGPKTIGGRFDRFGPQNRGVANRWTRGGILKLGSRRSEVEKVPDPLDRRGKTWMNLPLG